MSIRIMSIVWDSDLPSAEKFVALALADFANDDGAAIYPSVGRVAWKCGLSERAVQYTIAKLKGRGVLRAMPGKPLQGGRGITNEYRLDMRAIPRRDPFRPKGADIAPLTEKGAIDDEKGAIRDRKGATDAPDPSGDPSGDPSTLQTRAREADSCLADVRDLFAAAFNERRGSVKQRRKMERLCRTGVTLDDFQCAIAITNQQPRDDGFTYALTVAEGVRDDRLNGISQASAGEHRGARRGYVRGVGPRGSARGGGGDGRGRGAAVAVPRRAPDRLSPEQVARWAANPGDAAAEAP